MDVKILLTVRISITWYKTVYIDLIDCYYLLHFLLKIRTRNILEFFRMNSNLNSIKERNMCFVETKRSSTMKNVEFQ